MSSPAPSNFTEVTELCIKSQASNTLLFFQVQQLKFAPKLHPCNKTLFTYCTSFIPSHLPLIRPQSQEWPVATPLEFSVICTVFCAIVMHNILIRGALYNRFWMKRFPISLMSSHVLDASVE